MAKRDEGHPVSGVCHDAFDTRRMVNSGVRGAVGVAQG
jgi:hypothetical protein